MSLLVESKNAAVDKALLDRLSPEFRALFVETIISSGIGPVKSTFLLNVLSDTAKEVPSRFLDEYLKVAIKYLDHITDNTAHCFFLPETFQRIQVSFTPDNFIEEAATTGLKEENAFMLKSGYSENIMFIGKQALNSLSQIEDEVLQIIPANLKKEKKVKPPKKQKKEVPTKVEEKVENLLEKFTEEIDEETASPEALENISELKKICTVLLQTNRINDLIKINEALNSLEQNTKTTRSTISWFDNKLSDNPEYLPKPVRVAYEHLKKHLTGNEKINTKKYKKYISILIAFKATQEEVSSEQYIKPLIADCEAWEKLNKSDPLKQEQSLNLKGLKKKLEELSNLPTINLATLKDLYEEFPIIQFRKEFNRTYFEAKQEKFENAIKNLRKVFGSKDDYVEIIRSLSQVPLKLSEQPLAKVKGKTHKKSTSEVTVLSKDDLKFLKQAFYYIEMFKDKFSTNTFFTATNINEFKNFIKNLIKLSAKLNLAKINEKSKVTGFVLPYKLDDILLIEESKNNNNLQALADRIINNPNLLPNRQKELVFNIALAIKEGIIPKDWISSIENIYRIYNND